MALYAAPALLLALNKRIIKRRSKRKIKKPKKNRRPTFLPL